MNEYVIRIETGNAAFEECPGCELARILRRLADRIDDDDDVPTTIKLFDVNGNKVGSADRLGGAQ